MNTTHIEYDDGGTSAQWTLPDGEQIMVSVWRGLADGATVVQVDTTAEPDDMRLRINLNEAEVHRSRWSSE